MKVSTENDNNFGYEKITILVDNIPLKEKVRMAQIFSFKPYKSYKRTLLLSFIMKLSFTNIRFTNKNRINEVLNM
jgi:uncharacterized protein (DUF1919 family)